mgnify:CR=1 FL=1
MSPARERATRSGHCRSEIFVRKRRDASPKGELPRRAQQCHRACYAARQSIRIRSHVNPKRLSRADSASTHVGAASPHATSGETEETSDTKIIGANTRDDECQQRQGARPQTRCVLSRQPHPYSSPRVPSVRRTIRVIPMRRTTLLRNVPRRVPRQFAEGQHFFTTLLFTC